MGCPEVPAILTDCVLPCQRADIHATIGMNWTQSDAAAGAMYSAPCGSDMDERVPNSISGDSRDHGASLQRGISAGVAEGIKSLLNPDRYWEPAASSVIVAPRGGTFS